MQTQTIENAKTNLHNAETAHAEAWKNYNAIVAKHGQSNSTAASAWMRTNETASAKILAEDRLLALIINAR